MRLLKATFESFAEYVKKEDLRIIFFGAGTMGKVLIPYICNRYGLDERVICYMDNNPAKQGQWIELSTRKVPVCGLSCWQEQGQGKFVLMITNGDFAPVIQQLGQFSQLEQTNCFIAPVIQLMEPKIGIGINGIWKTSEKPLIPKIIHYCWFSGNPIPSELQRCIDSWKERCPNFEIVRWDESNYDVSKNTYTRQAYGAKKWGFIPDIARLEILYECGGFYLDTDVEVLKNLEPLCYQPGFCAREEWGHVNFGGGSGCIRHHDMVKEILDYRRDVPFIQRDGSLNVEASGYFETTPLLRRGLHICNETEIVENMAVYASEYFHPYNYGSGTENITSNTFSIHYFSGGWLGKKGNQYRKQTREKFSSIVSGLQELEA